MKNAFARAVSLSLITLGGIGLVFGLAATAPPAVFFASPFMMYGGFKTFKNPRLLTVSREDIINRLYPAAD